MTFSIPAKPERAERNDKVIRISVDTWEKLRSIRVQMMADGNEFITSHDEVVRSLINAYNENGQQK